MLQLVLELDNLAIDRTSVGGRLKKNSSFHKNVIGSASVTKRIIQKCPKKCNPQTQKVPADQVSTKLPKWAPDRKRGTQVSTVNTCCISVSQLFRPVIFLTSETTVESQISLCWEDVPHGTACLDVLAYMIGTEKTISYCERDTLLKTVLDILYLDECEPTTPELPSCERHDEVRPRLDTPASL